MLILVLNCGSSSIKYQLLNMKSQELLAKGLVDRIGIAGSEIKHKRADGKEFALTTDIADHTVGIDLILKALTSPEHGVITDVAQIEAVGHRVAHGGEYFSESVLLDADKKSKIAALCDIAPLHNPAHLKGIDAMERLLPGAPQVAVFDTSFHQTMPQYSYMYGIPYEYYDKYKVRRYGFHGTSHKFVAEKACSILGQDIAKMKIVTCHLGNGASITAIKNGKSIDTSMGFTPVEGLMMGTRCGDVDAGIRTFLAEKEGMDAKQLNDLANKKSGVLGISGVSSDMRDIEAAAKEGNARAQLALDMYYFRVKKYIGAYAAIMNGVDLVVFTGGIGENDFDLRMRVCQDMEYLGLEFDAEANRGVRGKDTVISKPGSKVKVMLITTDEEMVIAQDTLRIATNLKSTK